MYSNSYNKIDDIYEDKDNIDDNIGYSKYDNDNDDADDDDDDADDDDDGDDNNDADDDDDDDDDNEDDDDDDDADDDADDDNDNDDKTFSILISRMAIFFTMRSSSLSKNFLMATNC